MTGNLLLAAGPLFSEPTVQRAPDRWGPHLLLTALILVVVVLGWLGMRRSWKRRIARQSDLPALLSPPPGQKYGLVAEGLFLGATSEGNWLDRIAVHGLAARTRGQLLIGTDGIRMERARATPSGDAEWIPKEALTAVRLDEAHAGKVIGAGGVLVFELQLGPQVIEMGFRSDNAHQHEQLRERIASLLPAPAVGTAR